MSRTRKTQMVVALAGCGLLLAGTAYGVATVLLAPMPQVAGWHSSATQGGDAGDLEAGRTPKACDSDELQDKSCTSPGECLNACAFWCGSARDCSQCCIAFVRKESDYKKCTKYCDRVWSPNPEDSEPWAWE